jgi:hypothetical protein
MFSGSGMATGGWLAGFLYDHFGFYGAAFAAGMAFNAGNLLVVSALVLRHQQLSPPLLTGLGRTAAD